MEEDKPAETVTTEVKKKHSSIMNVSIRGWIALIVIGTACYMSARGLDIKEPLYGLVTLVAGFYLGQHMKEGQNK